MPWVTPRPPALAHLTEEVASAALYKHFGDFAKAAKELNVDRKDLRKLTWHNPRILNAAHERMGLFRIGVRSKILEAIYSPSAKRRRWGYDAMFDSYEFRDNLFAKALAPAPRQVVRSAEPDRGRLALEREVELEREAAAELASERAAEVDRERELGLEREAEVLRECEGVAARRRESSRQRSSAPAVQVGGPWPAYIRRPSRGGYR